MKKFKYSLYCFLLSLIFSTVILPITVVVPAQAQIASQHLHQIADQYYNTSRGHKRSISLLAGFIATIDILKEIDTSVEFMRQANEVATPIQTKLNQNIEHRNINIKAGFPVDHFN